MARTSKEKFVCFNCGKEYVNTNYYKSHSNFYSSIGRLPYCKQCIEKFYQFYYEKYINEGCLTPERNAVKRLCMAFDIYYREDVLNSSINKVRQGDINITPISQYMKMIQLQQYKNKSYDNTVSEEEKENFVASISINNISDSIKVDEKTIQFFGVGFTDEDY